MDGNILNAMSECCKLLRLNIDEEQSLCYDKKLLDLGIMNISKLWKNKGCNGRERKSKHFS